MADACIDCGRPFPPYSAMKAYLLEERGLVRRSVSTSVGSEDRCVDCARTHGYNYATYPHRLDDRDRPRYCSCPGYRRTPGRPEQCEFCFRRINPRYDHRIPKETHETS